MFSPDRPARDIHQVIEGVVEQPTTLSGCDVSIKLEIDAEVPDGLDRGKVRTLLENANTLGFIEKDIKWSGGGGLGATECFYDTDCSDVF